MEKTIEEKQDAVIAFCESACPNHKDRKDFDWGYLHRWGDHWSAHQFEGSCIFTTRPPRPDEYGIFYNFNLAYVLLGLETAEAVAELTKEKDHWQADCGRYIERLTDEESKNHHLKARFAKLADELEKNELEFLIEFREGFFESSETYALFTSRIEAINRVLAAHKKGESNG